MFTVNSYEEVQGKVVESIHGMVPDSDFVEIRFADGTFLTQKHMSDCCETVKVLDVMGDPEDLLGQPLLMCEVVSQELRDADERLAEGDESQTWTFCKFASAKGFVTIRWWGSSNGYYCEVPVTTIHGGAV